MGEAPGSVNLPGEIPDRLSLMIAIKNFSADNSDNVDDPTLPINPAEPPNTLLLIAGTSSIKEFNYASTFKRGGYSGDSSSMLVEMEDLRGHCHPRQLFAFLNRHQPCEFRQSEPQHHRPIFRQRPAHGG